jgi:hypothetical protein
MGRPERVDAFGSFIVFAKEALTDVNGKASGMKSR